MRFDRPPPEPLASAPGFLLAWNGQRIAHKFGKALEPLGLRQHHFGVLNLIAAEPGSTQQELVDRSMIDPSSMVAIVDELEGLGLAERQPHPGDRRKHAVHLTGRGQKTLGRARVAATKVANEVFGPLDPEEVEMLRRLLRRVAGVEAGGRVSESPTSPPRRSSRS